MTKVLSSLRRASQIHYDVAPVLSLREDEEPGWHSSVWIFAKVYGPSRAREFFYHTSVLKNVNIGSWHV